MIWEIFFILLAAAFAAGATGALFPPGAWYRGLDRPAWTPPDRAFPVIWTLLYILMAAAGARVTVSPGGGLAMALWALQIALNTLWTPVFFGLHRVRLALWVVIALWVAVAACMAALFAADRVAGWLFVPYLAWVSLALALNLAILRRNPEVG